MSEQYRFFDSIDGEDERFYTADEFAEYFRQVISTGILNGGTNLKVSSTETNMNVEINEGYAWIEGYLYKIDTEPLSLTLDAADPALNRIDRIVIRLDKSLEKRYVKAFILKGTPDTSPTPPPITRDENIYEVSLAQVEVIAGKSFIEAYQITDERLDTNVCGLANSLITADTTEIFNEFQDWLTSKTSNPDGEFYREWKTWLEGVNNWFESVVDESYLTKDNADNYYLKVDNRKTDDFNKGRFQSKFGFTNLELENCEVINGNLRLRDIVVYENEGTLSSHNITSSGYVGAVFTALQSFAGDDLSVRVKIKRKSISKLRLEIWTVDETDIPKIKIGEFHSNSYSDLDPDYSEKTFLLALTDNIEKDKRYCLIAYSDNSTADREINWAYSKTPNTNQDRKHLRSTNAGGSWTEYTNRYLWFHIPDLAEVPLEGVSTDEISINKACKWGNLKWIEEIPIETSVEINLLDADDNILKESISSITDLSDIDAAEHPTLLIQYKLARSSLDIKSPGISLVSWTWEGSLNSTEIIYSGMAKGEDLVLNNLDFKRYELVKIYLWMVVNNYGGSEGYFKLNEEVIASRGPAVSNQGYYFNLTIYKDVVEYGHRSFSKEGDSQTTANMRDIVLVFKSLLNDRVLDIEILEGANNNIEISSGKQGTGDYIIKIIGYR